MPDVSRQVTASPHTGVANSATSRAAWIVCLATGIRDELKIRLHPQGTRLARSLCCARDQQVLRNCDPDVHRGRGATPYSTLSRVLSGPRGGLWSRSGRPDRGRDASSSAATDRGVVRAPQGRAPGRLGAIAGWPACAADRSATIGPWARTRYTAFVHSSASALIPCEWSSRTALSKRSISPRYWRASCTVHFAIPSSSLKFESTPKHTRSCGQTEPTSILQRCTTGPWWSTSSARGRSGGVPQKVGRPKGLQLRLGRPEGLQLRPGRDGPPKGGPHVLKAAPTYPSHSSPRCRARSAVCPQRRAAARTGTRRRGPDRD